MENNEMNIQNNETIEPVVKQKSNKGLVVVIILLILIVLGLSGYLVYDKLMGKEDTPVTNEETNNSNNAQTDNSNKSVLKKDESKDVVYTLYTSKSTNNFETKIPMININSVYADRVNKEISEFMYKEYDDDNNGGIKCKEYCSQIIYKYYLNDNILSLVIKLDAAESGNAHEYYAYNIDIYTGEEVTNKDLVKLKNINESDFATKLSSTFKEAYPFDKYYPENEYGKEYKDFAIQTYNQTTDLKNCSIDNPIFLNENGELMVVIGVHYYAGGEGATYSLINMDTKQFIYYEDYKM